MTQTVTANGSQWRVDGEGIDKIRKARKDHFCSSCHGPIHKGQQYLSKSFKTPRGNWIPLKFCSSCVKVEA